MLETFSLHRSIYLYGARVSTTAAGDWETAASARPFFLSTLPTLGATAAAQILAGQVSLRAGDNSSS
jgi:hypothetical protein